MSCLVLCCVILHVLSCWCFVACHVSRVTCHVSYNVIVLTWPCSACFIFFISVFSSLCRTLTRCSITLISRRFPSGIHGLSTQTRIIYTNTDYLHKHRSSTQTQIIYTNTDHLHKHGLSTQTQIIYTNTDYLHKHGSSTQTRIIQKHLSAKQTWIIYSTHTDHLDIQSDHITKYDI